MVEFITKIRSLRPEDREIVKDVAHSIGIAEAMNEPLWLGDREHRTIYVNPVYEKLTGYSLEECIGQHADFCFDEESKKIIAEHHKLRKKGIASQYEGTILSKDGKKVPVLISGAPTETGGTIGIFINLTQIKKLTEQGKVAQQVLKHSTEAIVVLSKDRLITIWSNGARKVFGYKEEEILGKCIDIIIPAEEIENNQELLQTVEKIHHIKNIETHRLTKDGEIIDVSVSVTKVLDDKKKFIGYLVIYRDITEQKRTHTELQKRFEAIQDAYKELGLQKRQLDYLYEIINIATSSQDMETLENLIVSAFSLLTKADGVILRSYDEKRNVLKLKSCLGVSQKWWTKHQIPFENSISQEAFENKRPLIIDDIDTYHRHRGQALLKNHKFKTLISIPLFIGKKFIGSISLYANDSGKFRLIESEFLQNLGRQCSLALYAKILSK